MILPIPTPRRWHLVYRGKTLHSGDLGAVLGAYYKLPAEKRAKAVLRCGDLPRRKP